MVANVHGWYSLRNVNFVPICVCKNNMTMHTPYIHSCNITTLIHNIIFLVTGAIWGINFCDLFHVESTYFKHQRAYYVKNKIMCGLILKWFTLDEKIVIHMEPYTVLYGIGNFCIYIKIPHLNNSVGNILHVWWLRHYTSYPSIIYSVV